MIGPVHMRQLSGHANLGSNGGKVLFEFFVASYKIRKVQTVERVRLGDRMMANFLLKAPQSFIKNDLVIELWEIPMSENTSLIPHADVR